MASGLDGCTSYRLDSDTIECMKARLGSGESGVDKDVYLV